jgi:hypothetical protein
MPDARSRPGSSLDRPKPKKGKPKPKADDVQMAEAYDFNTPKKKKDKKKKKKGRGMLQVNREFTPAEWQSIARSMNDRRRPYAPRAYAPRSSNFGRVRPGYRRR